MEKFLSRLALVSFLGCLALVAVAADSARKTKVKEGKKPSCLCGLNPLTCTAEKMTELILPVHLVDRLIP